MSDKRTSARHRSAARRRMAQTGEKYTVALAAVLADARRGIDPESSTVIMGSPGYGFTARAIEKMKSRFPNETDGQIHARLIAEVETESFARSIEGIEHSSEMTKALILAASNVSMFVGGVSLREQLETIRDTLGYSGMERAKALIDIARPKLADADVRTLDSLVLTVKDARRETNTAVALNNIEYALNSLDKKTIPDHLKEKLSGVLLSGTDGLTRTRINAVPSQRLHMDAVYQIVAGSLDDESTHVYLWSRDLSDFNELLEHYDGAERDEDALGSLLASARTHGDEKVIVVIDHQGVLSHRSADLLTSLARERKDIEIIYVEREFVDEHRRIAPKASARSLIATRLAPAQFGVFGVADTIIDMLNRRGVRILRDQPLDVNPISEGTDNLAKSYVRDVIRLALIERDLRADSYDIVQHADAVIESLVATRIISFPEEMIRTLTKVDPAGSSADIAEATGGKTIDLGALATGDTIDPLGNSGVVIEESWSVGASPHETIIGLAGTGALKSPEYDAIFGRVTPLDTSKVGAALRAETKVFTDQNLPYITLDTGQRRREAAIEAIREYGVYTLVIGEQFDDYEEPFAIFVHPDDLTAEIVESPLVGYYVIDNVERAVEDLNGMTLITSLVATARAKGRAIRLLQSRESDVPAAIAGAVTRRIKSEEPYGLIDARTLVSLDSDVYADIFDDETGIDFTQGSHLIATGEPGSGKTVLMREIAKKMRSKGFEVNIVSPRPFMNEYGDQDERGVFEIIEHIHKTTKERLSVLRSRGLSSTREADGMPPVFLIVDYADYLFDGQYAAGEQFGNAAEVEIAVHQIRDMLRTSRAAGVHLIVGQNRVSAESKIASGEAGKNFSHRILMGRSSYAARVAMFRSPDLDFPNDQKTGEGVYQDGMGNVRSIKVRFDPQSDHPASGAAESESGTDRP